LFFKFNIIIFKITIDIDNNIYNNLQLNPAEINNLYMNNNMIAFGPLNLGKKNIKKFYIIKLIIYY
jgi:hypothetical protein